MGAATSPAAPPPALRRSIGQGEDTAGKDVILASHGWESMYYRGRRRLQEKAAV
jgi:hypothetical protein